MKRETLEKIRNILEHLFELFIFILIMSITFGSLSVHAAEDYYVTESNITGSVLISHILTFTNNDGKNEIDTNEWSFNLSNDGFYGIAPLTDGGDVYALYMFDLNNHGVSSPKISYISVVDWNIDGKNVFHSESPSNNKLLSFSVGSFESPWTNPNNGIVYDNKWSIPLPVFVSQQAFTTYCKNGDKSGLINISGSIDNPDFEDTAYAFTGFTANNKMTATWTGTTERTYLQDQEVEEYVRVNYYFADKEAQDTIKQADAYPDEFATADKTLTIDVSGLKPDDENWFLRYIRITPCYRQAGLGAWGDFYHGEPSYVYFNQDGSIDRIDAPYIKGELSTDMERPVIVLHEAANGNPTESDFSYFEFNNAQSDYFFEMKGRWYTTNDFDLYRDKLVWKYKYSTLLKNNLSTWVSVSDNRSSVGRFQFDVLGKSSWDNLLSSYPVDDRNYIGGSYNLFNKITGYSDALETLKMLLKQPYSLFNGYEVYVRYFRYDENGGIQYSKWTHFYNNLADSDGSSGSRLDDLDNMYSENQSDKGLTDDELSDLENGGNSRNDLDAVPKNNYDYSSLENATMNFFDLLKNFGTMLGQFPSMVAAVFGFLPPWLIGLIAVGIGAVIVCRFIGR